MHIQIRMKWPLVFAFLAILTVSLGFFFMTIFFTVEFTFYSQNCKLDLSGKLTQESKTFKENMEILSENRSDDRAYEISDDADIVPASARISAKRLFNNNPLSIWTKDWNTTRLESLIKLLKPFGVHFVVEFEPQYCSNLDCKVDERLEMSPQMDEVDLILCGQLSSTCDYFLKSWKNTLILPSLSHYANHYSAGQLDKYNQEFANLASNRKNVFGSTNMFDAKLFQIMTGAEVQLLPTMYDEVATQYSNILDEYALIKSSNAEFFDKFYSNFTVECNLISCSLKIKNIDVKKQNIITNYRAVIVIPNEVSMASVLEVYHKNVPIFVPSPELFAKWQIEHQIIQRRIPPAFLYLSQSQPHAGLDGKDFENVLDWIKLTDFYQFLPYAIMYDSIKDLVSLMTNIDDDFLWEVSNNMQAYNVRFKKSLITKWRDLLLQYTRLAPYDNL